jgi:hypothetical protein
MIQLFKGSDGLDLLILIILITGIAHTIYKHFDLHYKYMKQGEENKDLRQRLGRD